jgi:LPS sulfotransferase NodH
MMTTDTKSCVLLVAAERSGTHLLRSLLENTGVISAPAEICNASANTSKPYPLSFFAFRHRLVTTDPSLLEPTDEHQRLIIEKYIAFLHEKFPSSSIVVCDIKYAHVHNFNSFWWDFSIRPFLLGYAREKRLRIIHLVRRKVYQTAISTAYAKQSGVWRATQPDQLSSIKISVDLRELERRVGDLRKTFRLFKGWLMGCNVAEIHYEDLVGEDQNKYLQVLADFLGLDREIRYQPQFIKTIRSHQDSISNFDEIERLLEKDISDDD